MGSQVGWAEWVIINVWEQMVKGERTQWFFASCFNMLHIEIDAPLNMPTYLWKTAAADATAVSSMDAIIICAC